MFCCNRPEDVPGTNGCKQLVTRFHTARETRPPIRAPTPEADVQKFKTFFSKHLQARVQEASKQLHMALGKRLSKMRNALKCIVPLMTS